MNVLSWRAFLFISPIFRFLGKRENNSYSGIKMVIWTNIIFEIATKGGRYFKHSKGEKKE